MSNSDRRQILKAGAVAGAGVLLGSAGAGATEVPGCKSPTRPGHGPNAEYFPNAVLTRHDGRRALFYDDLLAGGRTVLIHFFSIAGEAQHPRVANIARVQEHLGERLGREVFIYSLTSDPEQDSPRVLAEFAQRLGARPGWLFLTGENADLELLRGRLFSHNGMFAGGRHAEHEHKPQSGPAAHDCSLGLVRYGNESIGLWGACPAIANPEWIARRLSWVTPRPEPRREKSGKSRRKGPLPSTWRS